MKKNAREERFFVCFRYHVIAWSRYHEGLCRALFHLCALSVEDLVALDDEELTVTETLNSLILNGGVLNSLVAGDVNEVDGRTVVGLSVHFDAAIFRDGNSTVHKIERVVVTFFICGNT